jgi:hypothetical protein
VHVEHVVEKSTPVIAVAFRSPKRRTIRSRATVVVTDGAVKLLPVPDWPSATSMPVSLPTESTTHV